MLRTNSKIPEAKVKETTGSFEVICENGFDYKSVEKYLADVYERMFYEFYVLENPRITDAFSNSDYKLIVLFSNRETRIFSMKEIIQIEFYKDLRDMEYFNRFEITFESIQWPNGQILCSDTIYGLSVPIV